MTSLVREPFGSMPDGRPVEQFTLANARGMRVSILSLGGIIRSILVPDSRGAVADVALGFDTVEEYLADGMYVGALIGRYANRIARGRFTLDGVQYRLPVNDGPNQLHGGPAGFNRVLWAAEPDETDEGNALRLRYRSPDGDGGFPGTLDTTVRFVLGDENELTMTFDATTDRPTPVNLTSHVYFNLAGAGSGDTLDQELTLAASYFTPIDRAIIPTGEIRAVGGTAFDLRHVAPIRARLDPAEEQLAIAFGYDHNFIIDRPVADRLAFAARLRDPATNRQVEILTTEPGIQFYGGGGLRAVGKGGVFYAAHAGVALETQHFPNSVNEPSFPSTILRPGGRFTSTTVYRFSA